MRRRQAPAPARVPLQVDPLEHESRHVLLDSADPKVFSSDEPPQRAMQEAFVAELLERYDRQR